jgi:transposase
MQVKRRRHTPEQVIRKLREAERLLVEGQQIPEVAKQLEVSEQTFHRWRVQYRAMTAEDVKRLKDLERENVRLKRIVADKELKLDALREVAKGRMKVKLLRVRPSSAGDASRRRCDDRRPRRVRLSGAPASAVLPG